MRRQVLKILAGSGGAALVGLFLTPLLTRLFTPSIFGQFATFSALTAIFVGVSTLRVEIHAVREEDETQASRLLGLSVAIALVVGVGLLLCSSVVVALLNISPLWLALGPAVTISSLQLVGVSALTRSRRYGRLSWTNFAQGAGVSIIQVLLGIASPGVGALVAGFLVPRLAWMTSITNLRWSQLRGTWRSVRRYAIVAGPSAGINSIASQAPLLLTSWLFGSTAVAILAMAMRILVAPLAMLGQAAASVVLGEVGRALRAGEDASHLLRSGARSLATIGALPCLLVGGLAPWAAPAFLGAGWSATGVAISLLAVGAYAQLIVAPFSQVLNLTGHSKWLLGWDSLRLVSTIATFGVPFAVGASLTVAILCYSLTMCLAYTVLYRLCIGAAQQRPPLLGTPGGDFLAPDAIG